MEIPIGKIMKFLSRNISYSTD